MRDIRAVKIDEEKCRLIHPKVPASIRNNPLIHPKNYETT